MRQVMGNYFDMVSALSGQQRHAYSYLDDRWSDVSSWQRETRAMLSGLLSYQPESPPLDAQIQRTYRKDGLIYEHITYAQPFGPRTEGIFLRPENAESKLPSVLALHDHSAFKYFGKEKITAVDNEHPMLVDFKRVYYGGRSWATELARRGYCVFVPDVFLWGSRKQPLSDMPKEVVGEMERLPPESVEAIEAYNRFASEYETIVAKSLFLAGTTWPGVMLYDDRRALDYLASRPEVDASKLGCGGLSGGGNRAIFLSAMDERIQASLCVGFMCGMEEIAKYRVQCHTWMFHLPGLAARMDLQDVQSLHGPRPTMVLYATDDPLWTLEGQRHADTRLRKIYAKMGAPEMYDGRFYPGGHRFDVAMQADAFDFLDRRLQA